MAVFSHRSGHDYADAPEVVSMHISMIKSIRKQQWGVIGKKVFLIDPILQY